MALERIELRVFSSEDWPWVQDWFRDPLLNRELGPMDNAWIEAVLRPRHGVQLVATIETEPVALIGCVWGTEQHPSHYITDIAVAPYLRGQGLAAKALELVMLWPGHPPTAKWTAFVMPRNSAAQTFFRKNAWRDVGLSDGMVQFKKSLNG